MRIKYADLETADVYEIRDNTGLMASLGMEMVERFVVVEHDKKNRELTVLDEVAEEHTVYYEPASTVNRTYQAQRA